MIASRILGLVNIHSMELGQLKSVFFLLVASNVYKLIYEQFVCLKDKGQPVGIFEIPNAINLYLQSNYQTHGL